MNLPHLAYRGVASGLFLTLFPPFFIYSHMTGKYKTGMGERLGNYPAMLRRRKGGPPRIWIHAASVGEASVAISIIDVLEKKIPGLTVVLSTTTEHGRRYAEKRMAGTCLESRSACVFAPIDLTWTARRAMAKVRPDALAWVETELWPNWLMEAGRMGIRTALVNGRISVRSIGRYLKIRPLMEKVLAQVDAFSMISEGDARRITKMGAPANRIEIHGNAKFDVPVKWAAESENIRMRTLFNIPRDTPVFVAGSIRGDEDAMVLEAYSRIVREIPGTVLIMAPRHMDRVRQIAQLTQERGFSCQLRTGLAAEGKDRRAQVIILDTIGELQSIYGVADIVFCGGSLVPTGGQNILEAAAWGKPVIYGPSMEDFLDAKEILDQTGGGVQIHGVNELKDKVIELLRKPDLARTMGRRARQALTLSRGAAERHAEVMLRLLSK